MWTGRFSAALAVLLALGTVPAAAEFVPDSGNREPLRKFMASLVPRLARTRLVEANVPTVVCPKDGQIGPQDAPALPKGVRVIVPEGTATSLAYYSAYEGMLAGVLAPRGWTCFGLDGSSGTILYVVPHRVDGPMLGRFDKVKDGPAVIRTFSDGDTSGRYRVEKVGSRIFPRARARFEAAHDEDLGNLVFTPWPADQLAYLTDFAVAYVTPAGAEGLGTAAGFAAASEPISGLALLMGNGGDGPHLEQIAVRLDRKDRGLYAAIAVAKLANMDALSQTMFDAAVPSETSALGLVTTFYDALGHANGDEAAKLVVPEKRASGPLSAQAITQFYSRLARPLNLIEIAEVDAQTVRARYRYRTAAGRLCDGRSVVTLRSLGGEALIERVRALNNC
jgi:hypothetical protein